MDLARGFDSCGTSNLVVSRPLSPGKDDLSLAHYSVLVFGFPVPRMIDSSGPPWTRSLPKTYSVQPALQSIRLSVRGMDVLRSLRG